MSQYDGAEEDAAELEFGEVLAFGSDRVHDASVLTNDELYQLMNGQMASGKMGVDSTAVENFQKSYSYIEKVCTTKSIDSSRTLAIELRTYLSDLKLRKVDDGAFREATSGTLHTYEIASLANLINPNAWEETYETVSSYIPSLSRYRRDDVERAIEIVKEVKERHGKLDGQDF